MSTMSTAALLVCSEVLEKASGRAHGHVYCILIGHWADYQVELWARG